MQPVVVGRMMIGWAAKLMWGSYGAQQPLVQAELVQQGIAVAVAAVGKPMLMGSWGRLREVLQQGQGVRVRMQAQQQGRGLLPVRVMVLEVPLPWLGILRVLLPF